MSTPLRVLAGFATIGLLTAGCTGPGPATPTGSARPIPARTTGPAGTASAGTGPAGTAPAGTGPVPDGAGVGVSCAHVIDRIETPPPGRVVLADAVALPPGRLEPSRTGAGDPARLFAKTGLVVRADSRVDLAVPANSAGRPWIGWGSPARPARTLHFPGCPDESGWLAFAGGFWVDAPACVPVTVRSAGREQRGLIGIGVDCPE